MGTPAVLFQSPARNIGSARINRGFTPARAPPGILLHSLFPLAELPCALPTPPPP